MYLHASPCQATSISLYLPYLPYLPASPCQATSSAAARVCEAESSEATSTEEKAERRQQAAARQTDSLRMAMLMSTVFEALAPYF